MFQGDHKSLNRKAALIFLIENNYEKFQAHRKILNPQEMHITPFSPHIVINCFYCAILFYQTSENMLWTS